jgi:outer membrane protein OmpA-like peptidoglycan-associated protein
MFQTKRLIILALTIAIACITTLFVVNAAGQEQNAAVQKQLEYVTGYDLKTVLFRDVNKKLTAARKVQADVLAPKNFGDGIKRYQEAEAELQHGKNLEAIQNKLREASAFFQAAIDGTKLAEVTFPNSMKARRDAQYTDSGKFSAKLWTEAEHKFNEAAGKLEDGDVNEAKKKAGEAERLYRQAELDAIKTNYLQETRQLLKKADGLKVKDHAPKTLHNAQELIKQAEKELNENRYDTDVARSLAREANYQAKHAIHLANVIKQMKDKDQSLEDLMVASEIPLQQIAGRANLSASFDTGLGKATNEIIAYIATYQDSVAGLSEDLDWYEQELYLQHARVAELEQQVGTEAKEKSALAQQIAKQAKTRELFASVERSFSRDEARVLREDNDIIIRLTGLDFPSAAATIEQQSFGLLTKVRDAINSFSECTVSVLGYTDSYGSDEQNLLLSNQRAEAVKQYLLANTKLDASRVEAFGYGESKPIASNETTEGRATNRRVEVVIHPWTGGTY